MNAGKILGAGFAGELREREPMARHTTLGIGGPAELMAYPEDVKDLALLMGWADAEGVPVFILGNGSNILVLDGGIPGLTVNMDKMNWTELELGEKGGYQVHAGAGLKLAKLVSQCSEDGLSGMEFAAGIPGTVGGAVVMNAGTKEAEMKDVLVSVTLVDKKGKVSRMKTSELGMGYRKTEIPEGSAVAEAAVAVVPWPSEEVKEKVAKTIRMRKAAQPSGVRSVGSTFKNPPGYSAWKLIDMVGLRGTSVGRAQVSSMHANFLINTGGATGREYRELMEKVVQTVQDRLNITLEPEVKIIGVDA